MEPRHRRPNPVDQLHAVRRMWIETRIEEPLDEGGAAGSSVRSWAFRGGRHHDAIAVHDAQARRLAQMATQLETPHTSRTARGGHNPDPLATMRENGAP